MVSKEDKVRLLAMGKRKRLGPLGTVMDPTEVGSGSASFEPSHAVKQSGKYDVWSEGSTSDRSGAQEKFEVANTDMNKVPVKVCC